MSSSPDTVQFICDQAGLGARLTFRKMFGEYALYLDGKVTALVCDDQLFLKPTTEGRAFLGAVPEGPPYPGCRPFLMVSAELDNPERLAMALEITTRALPAPQAKAKAKTKTKTKTKAKEKKAAPRSAKLDTPVRVVRLPADLRKALAGSKGALEKWDRLSFSHRREHVEAVEGAKKPETRVRRIGGVLAALRR